MKKDENLLKSSPEKDKVPAKPFVKEKSPISVIKDKKFDLPKVAEKVNETAQGKSSDPPDSPKSPKLKITSSVEIEEPKTSILKKPLKVLDVKIEKIPEVKVTLKPKPVISILKKAKEPDPPKVEPKIPEKIMEAPKKIEESKKLEIKKEPAKIEPISALEVKNLVTPKKIAEISKLVPKIAEKSIEPEKPKIIEKVEKKLEVKIEPKKVEAPKPPKSILAPKKLEVKEIKIDEPPKSPKETAKPKIDLKPQEKAEEPDQFILQPVPKIDKTKKKVEPIVIKPTVEAKIEIPAEKAPDSPKLPAWKLAIMQKKTPEQKTDATASKVLDNKDGKAALSKVGLSAKTPEPKQEIEITQPKPSLAASTQKEEAKDVNNNIVAAVDAAKEKARARDADKPAEAPSGYNPKHAVLHKKDICFVQPKEGEKTQLKQTEAPKGNEIKNTKGAINTVNKIAQQSDDSAGSFGVLASLSSLTKFPTLCDLSDNAKITNNSQSKQSKTNQSSIALDSLSSSDRTEESETVLTYRELKEIENISGTEESESESSEESSSYESDSDWSEGSMGKDKKFDPQKRVKLDFQKMKKCYVKEEKSAITLVARPRPLWKIKRNKNAQLVDSDDSDTTGEISSGDEEEEGTTPSDSASASNNSSTNSNRKKKSPSGSDASDIYEHITSLMPMMGVSTDNDDGKPGDEKNGDSLKTKNRLSTTSQDSGISGFYGATAPRSPRKMLGKRLVFFCARQMEMNQLVAIIC